MNKLTTILLLLVVIFTGISVSILLKNTDVKLGAIDNATVSEIASSSATYFRGAVGAFVPADYNTTATTTLLTFQGVHQTETIEIKVTATATTSPVGDQHFVVDASQDASTWYPLMINNVDTTGAQATQINLLATSTIYTLRTPVNGALNIPILKVKNVAAQYIRVRAWASASSTLLVTGFRLSQ